MNRLILSIVILSTVCTVFAQQTTCGTDEMVNHLRAKNPAYDASMRAWESDISQIARQATPSNGNRAQLYSVPVVFHIVLASQSQINAVRAQIAQQLVTLNHDFRKQNADTTSIRTVFKPLASDIEVEFCLAARDPSGNATTGIQERVTSHAAWDPDTEGDDMKFTTNGGLNAWNPSKYMNVWIVDIAGSQFGGVAGYAYIGSAGIHGDPEDGIVLDYSLGFGSSERSLSHEMGHYLGLYHTWGNSGGCSNDDGISDTPMSSTSNFGCNYNTNSCNTGSGDLPDQIENYMDYSSCPAMFTIEQKSVMRNILTGARASLITNNNGCQPFNVAPVADFAASATAVCPGSAVSFTDISSNEPTSWAWTFQSGSPATSTQQYPVVTYAANGNYTVTLIATNGTGSDSETKTGYITVGTGGTQTIFSEDFEGSFPGAWTVINPDNSITWESVTVAGSTPGTKAPGVNCYSYQTTGQRDGLISPVIDLSSNSQISLTFTYAHRRYSTSETDSLIIYASTNGGSTYPTRVYANAGGAGFATGYLLTSNFVPSAEADWCTESATGVACPVIDLAAFSGQANFRLKIEVVNDYGNNIYVDNVTLTGVCSGIVQPAPVADFTSNNTSGCNAITVGFTDLSTNTPTSWNWQFAGGNPATSSQQNPTITYGSPGTFSVTLTASNGDGDDVKTVNGYINVYSSPSASIAKSDVSCNGLRDGSALLTVTDGTPPYTYAWSNSATSQDVNNLSAGNYAATVTDVHQCSATAATNISENLPLSATASSTNVSCYGGNSGTAQVTVAGGATPYSYLWSNGASGLDINGLVFGTYQVTVIDDNDCTSTSSTTVTQPSVINVSANTTSALCYGDSNGAINLTLSGGLPGYNFQWSNGSTTEDLSNISSGNYSVTVTDANECTASYSSFVNQPNLVAITTSPDTSIYPGEVVQLSVSGCGNCNTYSWSPSLGLSDAGISNPVASPTITSTYNVTASDANGCSASASVKVIVLSELLISGKIITEAGQAIQGVTLNLIGVGSNSVITTTDGLYSFNVTPNQNYTVTPIKNNDLSATNGITTLDIIYIQQHILSMQALGSPYKIIAADVSASSGVSTLDVVLIRSVILNAIPTFPDGRLWAFVNSDFAIANPLVPFPFEDQRSYSSITANRADQDFIGIKLGDVNGSWNPNILKTEIAGEVQFVIEEYATATGEVITIPVSVRDFNNITGYQFTLIWDPNVLRFLEVNNQSLNGYYGTGRIADGMITTSWNDDQAHAISLDDNAVLFNLKFIVHGETGSYSKLSVNSELTSAEAYNESLDFLNVVSFNGSVKIGEVSSMITPKSLSNLHCVPNPFSTRANIVFTIPQDGTIMVIIYDLLGKKVKNFKANFNAGEHAIAWSGNDDHGRPLGQGLYQISLIAGEQAQNIKVLLVN